MTKIYFDHSATTPLDKDVLAAMMPYFSDIYGNASSIHTFGQDALAGVDKARKQLADFLNCESGEIVFTSGATESSNIAIKGLVKALKKQGREKIHIITSIVEHDAILEPCAELANEGVEITYIPVDKYGVVKTDKILEAIRPETALVSIMHVNSEIGTVQPIRAIAKSIMKLNDKNERDWKKLRPAERGEKPNRVFFHTDATQALNFYNCDTQWNYVDMLSLSAHKIYGPKGVGALYIKEGTPMLSLQTGGHQESNKRSGTLNVTGIVGLGAAVANLSKENQEKNNKYTSELRDKLANGILESIPDARLNTNRDLCTPSHAHFSFPGAEGEALLISLDLDGIAISTGSACASGSLKASHVLLAMGIEKEVAHCSIRITLGKHNTEKEVDKLLKVLPETVERFRKMNPLYNK